MSDVRLLDSLDVFACVVDELMGDMGLDSRKYTRDEIRYMVRECFSVHEECWQEFVLWVIYGNDKRAKTLAVMRAGRNLGNIYSNARRKGKI